MRDRAEKAEAERDEARAEIERLRWEVEQHCDGARRATNERDALAATVRRVEAVRDAALAEPNGVRWGSAAVAEILTTALAGPDDTEDDPTVCVTHMRFLPCRKDGRHVESSDPADVAKVAAHQAGKALADDRPHSRACGIRRHEHGVDCHANCPTCAGGKWGL